MDKDPIKSAARLRKRLERLGPGPYVCLLCGYTNVWALTQVSRSFLELHHVVIEMHDSQLTVLLCLNCHSAATEDLRKAGTPMEPATNNTEHVAIMLEALAVFLGVLIGALRRWVALLRNSSNQEKSNEI